MSFSLRNLFSSKQIVILLVICVLLIGLSALFGAKEHFEIRRLAEIDADASTDAKSGYLRLENKDNDVEVWYNQAYLLYREGRYDEAIDRLRKCLDQPGVDSVFLDQIRYNLGNSLYRLAEKSESAESAIKLLTESLSHYRVVISNQRRLIERGQMEEVDSDVALNYVIARQRLKLLNDLLSRQKEEKTDEKSPYELVKELLEEEETIRALLSELEGGNDLPAETRRRVKKDLLERRERTALKLKQIQEKIDGLTRNMKGQSL